MNPTGRGDEKWVNWGSLRQKNITFILCLLRIGSRRKVRGDFWHRQLGARRDRKVEGKTGLGCGAIVAESDLQNL